MCNTSKIAQRVHKLQVAQRCDVFGARVRTMFLMTGLNPRELRRLLFSRDHPAPRGRMPDTRDWYHHANLLCHVGASVVMSAFQQLRGYGFEPDEALLCAYGHYRTVCAPPYHISFDRAFDMAAHLEGIWIATEPSFTLAPCATCGCASMNAIGAQGNNHKGCMFCRVVQRHGRDRRVQATYPRLPRPTRAAALQLLHRLGLVPLADDEIPRRKRRLRVDPKPD